MLIEIFNRILSHDPPAREKLSVFAGKSIRIELSPFVLEGEINDRGFLVIPAAQISPDLRITMPLASAPLALFGKDRITQEARVEGNIALANAVNGLFENLPLAIEQETENWLGPVIAHRLSVAGKGLAAALSKLQSSVERNAGQALVRGPLPEAETVRTFSYDVNGIAQRTEALSQRIARLGA